MANVVSAKTRFNLPIFCQQGVSHYVPAEVKWEIANLDDGSVKTVVDEITITEMQVGEA